MGLLCDCEIFAKVRCKLYTQHNTQQILIDTRYNSSHPDTLLYWTFLFYIFWKIKFLQTVCIVAQPHQTISKVASAKDRRKYQKQQKGRLWVTLLTKLQETRMLLQQARQQQWSEVKANKNVGWCKHSESESDTFSGFSSLKKEEIYVEYK